MKGLDVSLKSKYILKKDTIQIEMFTINNTSQEEEAHASENEGEDEAIVSNSFSGARISFHQALKEIVEKSKKQGIDFCKGNECIAILCCTDGAKHSVTKHSECDVMTSSICAFNRESINEKGKFPSNPKNAITMLQVQANECIENVKNSFGPYFDEKIDVKMLEQTFQYNAANIKVMELHDGKFLYILTQHSLWN